MEKKFHYIPKIIIKWVPLDNLEVSHASLILNVSQTLQIVSDAKSRAKKNTVRSFVSGYAALKIVLSPQ